MYRNAFDGYGKLTHCVCLIILFLCVDCLSFLKSGKSRLSRVCMHACMRFPSHFVFEIITSRWSRQSTCTSDEIARKLLEKLIKITFSLESKRRKTAAAYTHCCKVHLLVGTYIRPDQKSLNFPR